MQSKKRIRIMTCLGIAIVGIVLVVCLYIYTRPVSWDAAACSGGYSSYIFDKYKNELAEEYARSIETRVIDVGIVEDSYDVQWEGKKLYVELTIWHGEQQQRVTFIGQRKWIDTYEWVEISVVPIENKTYLARELIGEYDVSATQSIDVLINASTAKGRAFTVTADNAPKFFEELRDMMLAEELVFEDSFAGYDDDTYDFSLTYTDADGHTVTFYKVETAKVRVGDKFYRLSEEVDVTSINEGIRAGFGDWGAVRDLE